MEAKSESGLSVEHRALSAGWLTRIQTVFRNALALCQAAHLSNFKAFDKKIANLCLTQPDPNLGLFVRCLHPPRKARGTKEPRQRQSPRL